MIFITVGTERFQFDRIIKIIDEAVVTKKMEGEVFGQIGSCAYKPKSFSYKEFISFDEMICNIKRADIVISHAGVGSLLLCANFGKIPILFPRKSALSEHVDDHQEEFAKKMDALGKALIARSAEDLIFDIINYNDLTRKKKVLPSGQNKERLVKYLNSLILGPSRTTRS